MSVVVVTVVQYACVSYVRLTCSGARAMRGF